MYKNKNGSRNNITGLTIKKYRQEQKHISQRQLAELMKLEGIDLNKNAIQRIESGERFITDIELLAFAKVFGVTPTDLYTDL